MSTAKLLRWLQEHTVNSGLDSTTLQPLADHEPPSSEESQNTQVWEVSFVCKTKYNGNIMTPKAYSNTVIVVVYYVL